jgi:hypothetical protein
MDVRMSSLWLTGSATNGFFLQLTHSTPARIFIRAGLLCRPAVFAFEEREMSSPAIISSGTDRTTRLGGPLGVGNARPRSKAQVRQALQIAATISVLMLIMLGGLALRAVLALTQGIQ